MSKWIREEDLREDSVISGEEVQAALDIGVARMAENAARWGDRFFGANSIGNYYQAGENRGWTTGFYTGLIWLAYENEKDPQQKELLLQTGNAQVESFLHRIENLEEVDHHDMGFLYSPSCVAAWKLGGNEKARKAALLAADQLLRRFQERGQFLQAWGSMQDPGNYRFIIDCLLNLPLLYWAAEESGEERYREIAERHIHTAMANLIREDDSCWHTVFMNPVTGGFDHGATCQGYQDGSAWARGQAWGIYGTAVAYRYTGREEYITYFKRVTSYFLNHLPSDRIPCWDLTFGDGDVLPFSDPRVQNPTEDKSIYDAGTGIQPRDSSSAIIAACGMLEMSDLLRNEESGYYRGLAGKLLKAVLDRCFEPDDGRTNGLVLHGTYSHHSPYNTCSPEGTDECVIWGDYYFLEALNRLHNPAWKTYW